MLCEALTNEAAIVQLEELKAGLMDGALDLDLNWLATHRWVAIPLIPGVFVAEDAEERLASAFHWIGCAEVFMVATEDFVGDNPPYLIGGAKGDPKYLRVQATKAGLRAAFRSTGSFCYLLTPRDRRAAFLQTNEEYDLIAGPPDFVRRALGCDIEAGWRQAHEQVEELVANIIFQLDPSLSEKERAERKADSRKRQRDFLERVIKRYHDAYEAMRARGQI